MTSEVDENIEKKGKLEDWEMTRWRNKRGGKEKQGRDAFVQRQKNNNGMKYSPQNALITTMIHHLVLVRLIVRTFVVIDERSIWLMVDDAIS